MSSPTNNKGATMKTTKKTSSKRIKSMAGTLRKFAAGEPIAVGSYAASARDPERSLVVLRIDRDQWADSALRAQVREAVESQIGKGTPVIILPSSVEFFVSHIIIK